MALRQPKPISAFNRAKPKTLYNVVIEDSEYPTWAYNMEGARSNAAFRFAQENDMDVKLVLWRIKKGELFCEINELP